MKTLLIDIEMAPKVALVWRFFKENISPKQVKEHGHILSFAAKWLGEDEVFYKENRKSDDTEIVEAICRLLDEADFVVAHNGEDFDLKQIRARAIVNGIRPFSPVKVIDTLKIARREFGFPANSLAYLSTVLNLKTKKKTHSKFPGFELWLECLRNNEEAWQEMKEYNIDDVISLEELYLLFRSWDTKHPNVTTKDTDQNVHCCPKCGSADMQRRGFATTQVGVFQRYQCQTCFGWSRSRYSEAPKNEFKLVNVVN